MSQDRALSASQRQQLSRLKDGVNGMSLSLRNLLEAAVVGSDSIATGVEAQETDIATVDYRVAFAAGQQKAYQATVASQSLLSSAEQLLAIVAELRTANILYDHERIAKDNQDAVAQFSSAGPLSEPIGADQGSAVGPSSITTPRDQLRIG